MDALKKFLNKKKTDVKFKSAGPGQKLTGEPESSKAKGATPPGHGHRAGGSSQHDQPRKAPSGPSEEKRQAAAAALARLEKQRKPESNEKDMRAARQLAFIKEQARREIEAEMRLKEAGQPSSSSVEQRGSEVDIGSSVSERVVDPALFAVEGVFFTCPLIGPEVASKAEIQEMINQFLRDQPEEELAITSCLMIHSCNKPREKVNTCVDILCKYLDNIINNPDNPKVRKIRFANKAYQERVAVVEGSAEFLRAAGFEKTRVNNDDTGEEEDIWYFGATSENMEAALALLAELRDTLKQTTPIRPEIDRNVQVLMPAEVKNKKELPPDFYQLTAEEIKREQQTKTELLERELTLRTKAQREKDELREQRMYRYCVMRIRFPDGFTLQGTFWAHEKLSDLHDFVQQNLLAEDLKFTLKMPRGEALQPSDATLSENRLPPASILNFHVENPPPGIASGEISYLKPEILALVKSME
ncbi:UBX domain-containing protein 6 [Orchesella cincta]|uniref:UBX domain-containing protein 6 n=1 Tax=Orchesella cincta TaxID=48709 RepID=A0A1D2NDX9_ORCCI|nr:UBX domain-containing protein 6 [Orchesella cincta]